MFQHIQNFGQDLGENFGEFLAGDLACQNLAEVQERSRLAEILIEISKSWRPKTLEEKLAILSRYQNVNRQIQISYIC